MLRPTLLMAILLTSLPIVAQADAGKTVDSAVAPFTSTGEVKIPEKAALGTVEGAAKKAKNTWLAFKGGKYREGIAGLIVLLVYFWRRYGSKLVIGRLSPWWVGFVTVLFGYIGTLPEMLAAESFNWVNFIWAGLITSGQAMLFWQTVGKKVLPKVFGEVKNE